MTFKTMIEQHFGMGASDRMYQEVKKTGIIFTRNQLGLGILFACQLKEQDPSKTLEAATREGLGKALLCNYKGGNHGKSK